MIHQAQFHNMLRILTSLDHHEVPFLDGKQWQAFRTDPYRFTIRADDPTYDRIWAAMQVRMRPAPHFAA